MSEHDWAPVSADETVLWQGQPRRRVVLQGVVVGVVAAVLVVAGAIAVAGSGAVSPTLAVAVGVPLALLALVVPAAIVWLWRWSTRYLLTDAALYHRTGVLSLTVTELRLSKIQNTTYSQSVLGTVFDHGTVTIDTAGSEGAELTLRALDGPQSVHQRIAEQTAGHADGARGDIPGTIQQWQAVRKEARRIRRVVADE